MRGNELTDRTVTFPADFQFPIPMRGNEDKNSGRYRHPEPFGFRSP